MRAWGAPQQAQLLDERFCFIFQCLYQEKSNVLKDANGRCLQQGTDCLCTVARRLLGQLKFLCEPPLEEGTVQRAAVQVLGLGESTWNAASDVSTSGAAVKSNKQSFMMHWVSVGIL